MFTDNESLKNTLKKKYPIVISKDYSEIKFIFSDDESFLNDDIFDVVFDLKNECFSIEDTD